MKGFVTYISGVPVICWKQPLEAGPVPVSTLDKLPVGSGMILWSVK